MPDESLNYSKWLQKAEEDELSIRALVSGGGSPSTITFLSQQMAEKYLKGLLVFYKKSYIKVHDLLGLETLLLEVNPGITKLHEDLSNLNRYYIESRYPGDYPEILSKEAEEAYQSAKKVKEFVLQVVNSNKLMEQQ